MLQIPGRIRRQGFPDGVSALAPLAVAGVATAGVFRNEIADILRYNKCNLVLYRSYLYLLYPYFVF